MKQVLVAVAILALTACAAGMGAKPPAIKEEPVTYQDGGATLKGFIVYDESRPDRRPGILIVHERWGITPHARSEARNLPSRAIPRSCWTCMATEQCPTTSRSRGSSRPA
jgi:hypothetical protein